MVRITCPIEILKNREIKCGDRCLGSAESSAKYLYPSEGYDFVVDTSSKSSKENAKLIFDAFFK